MDNFDDLLNISVGFYIVNKQKYENNKKKSLMELKALWDKLEQSRFDRDTLQHLLFHVDEKDFKYAKKIYHHETSDLNNTYKELVALYTLLASCEKPLSNYFFMNPELHFSSNNFMLFNQSNFLYQFYWGNYTPENQLAIEYSAYLYWLTEPEMTKFIDDVNSLNEHTLATDFDRSNLSFLKSKLNEVTSDNHAIVLAKSM